jgi:hypothetical protein
MMQSIHSDPTVSELRGAKPGTGAYEANRHIRHIINFYLRRIPSAMVWGILIAVATAIVKRSTKPIQAL